MRKSIYLLLLAATAALITGCAHAEKQEELSERPWNAPKGWEHGVPGSIMRGR